VDDTRDVIDALKLKFTNIIAPAHDDICYATQNRQTAVKALAGAVDLLLVIGSKNSSNSCRLKEVSESVGTRAYLIDDVTEIDPAWLDGVRCVGITAGASAPESLVEELVGYFRDMGVTDFQEIDTVREEVQFSLPPELARDRADRLAARVQVS
jgi:4-hydroxy-3-methylbut-2-enyl diphosphate reductase